MHLQAFVSTAISMVRAVLFGVGFALLLPLWFGLDGVLYSVPVSDVRELLGLIVKWTAVVCLICTVLFEAFPLFFIQMFGADGELYTQFAVQCLRIYLSLILFTCVQKACAIFLQSIGHAKAAAPLSVLRDILLIVFSIAAPMVWGVTGIFWAAPIADVLAIAVTAVVMLRLWNQLKGSDGQSAED